MRRIVSIAVFLAVCSFVPLAAQDDGANVYQVNYITVLDAKYITYVQEVLLPVWAEFVRRGLLVSFHMAAQVAGAGDATHIGIEEYPNWDAVDDLPGAYDEASLAVHGVPWAEVTAEYFPLTEIRKIRTETYWSIKP